MGGEGDDDDEAVDESFMKESFEIFKEAIKEEDEDDDKIIV